MKVKCQATAADGTVFKRQATKAYSFAVIYHRIDGGYYTPTFHTRRDLAERAAADHGSSTIKTEIVPVDVTPPTKKQILAEIKKQQAVIDWWKERYPENPSAVEKSRLDYIASLQARLETM